MDGLPQDFGDMGNLPDLGSFDESHKLGDFGGFDAPETVTRMPAKLSKKAKAAVIVRLLAAEDVKLPLANFPEEMQVELAHQMTDLRHISKDTLVAVVEEFINELDEIGLSFPGGLEGALNVLEGTISPTTSAKLRKNAGFSLTGDPWERIADLDPVRILPILSEESVEVGAVLLSKLKVAKSAQLLSMLPGDRARRIAYAISLTSAIAPDVVQRIGISIAAKLDAQPSQAFTDAPTERVGAILNFSASATRDGVLEGLDETDKEFAEEVRKNIFTFANIATRVDARDIAKVVRGVEQDLLIKALAGATGEAAKSTEFILTNMSKRMADGLREEIETVGKVKESDAEEAMNAVVGGIRQLEADGEIFLLTGDE
ncbi:flagellar motor switch protein FliG [Pacificibacter maritimus]|uniref:Flagellar motor switch protein FliG n=1 Tax=Pacificibacter maritimus TaxID=762213 RepID=A0A3N4UKW5_9RHOB|nr:FliG C-terminal domain-containing protein [Pacificibacter maritimus]RPE71242.1 flagellar motor switch protein FliG [Pacificibacter maritimus]